MMFVILKFLSAFIIGTLAGYAANRIDWCALLRVPAFICFVLWLLVTGGLICAELILWTFEIDYYLMMLNDALSAMPRVVWIYASAWSGVAIAYWLCDASTTKANKKFLSHEPKEIL